MTDSVCASGLSCRGCSDAETCVEVHTSHQPPPPPHTHIFWRCGPGCVCGGAGGGGRRGQRVEEQGTWAAQKHSEAGYGRPVDRGVWTVKRPPQQPAHPQYANYWAPLTRKRHTTPHSAQPQHTNYWAPRTRKRHQQEHRPQRPTESSDPTQHAEGRTGDRPGPRKGATTRRNVTQGGGVRAHCCRAAVARDAFFFPELHSRSTHYPLTNSPSLGGVNRVPVHLRICVRRTHGVQRVSRCPAPAAPAAVCWGSVWDGTRPALAHPLTGRTTPETRAAWALGTAHTAVPLPRPQCTFPREGPMAGPKGGGALSLM